MSATSTDYDVIVIGGGFAGVTAARDLGKTGLRILLIEARDRLGGRTWYSEDALEGWPVEMGGGWLGEEERYVMAEVERYEIALNREGEPPTRWLWSSANGVRESPLPVPFEQLSAIERVLIRCGADAARITPGRPISEQGLEALDKALPDYLGDLDLPVETRDLLAGFWGGMASNDWSEMSALLALSLQRASGGTFFDFLNTVMLGPRFEHGTIELVQALATDSGADIQLGEPVREVRTTADRVTVSSDRREMTAGAVVCAVPLNVLGEIAFEPPLSEAKQRAAAQGHSGRGFKLWIVARNTGGGVFGIGDGGPFHHLFTVDERGDESLLCAFGPDETPDAKDLKSIEARLRHYLPEAEVVASATHDWRSDPYAKGTWFVYPAGFIHEFETELLRPEGRVVLAGADVSVHRPGYIDGAVESGRRAATIVSQILTKTFPSAA